MNPASVLVRAEDLATSDAEVERFVLAVFCQEETVIVLRGVNFAFDSYALDSKAMGILDEAAGLIKSKPNTKIVLTGWTDSRGTDTSTPSCPRTAPKPLRATWPSRACPPAAVPPSARASPSSTATTAKKAA